MKRTLLYSVTLMLIASISLSSCSQNGDYQNKEAHNMQAFYFMDFSRDLINMADIEVTYRLADSHVVIDTLTSDQMESFMIHQETIEQNDSNGVLQSIVREDSTILYWQPDVMEFDSIPARISISVRILPKPLNEVNKDSRYKLYLWYGLSVAEDGHNWKTRDAITLLDWVDVHGSNVGKAIDIANDDRTTLDCTTQRVGPNPDDVKTVRTK